MFSKRIDDVVVDGTENEGMIRIVMISNCFKA